MALGNILGSVLQGMLSGQGGGQAAGAAQANPLAGVIAALLTPQQGQAAQAFGSGGIGELLSQFRGAGMAQEVDSWVGPGANKPIDPHSLEKVFAPEQLKAMSQEADVPQNDLLSGLARMLPEVINGLTPQGQVPAQGGGTNDMLASVLGSLLGGRR